MGITDAVGETSEEWLASTETELAHRVGDDAAAQLLERFRKTVPAGYDELNWPSSAANDLPIIDRLSRVSQGATGPARVATSMLHYLEAAVDEWRFRVYHVGAAVPLADLLPLLDQLGFRALDERSFVFEPPDGEPVWLHDVGVRLTGDPAELTEARRDEVQRAFVAELTGEVEVDGFNRLVLLAGLSAREAEVVRAYARYLRQIGFPSSQQYIEATVARHAAITRDLVELVTARFDPAVALAVDAAERCASLRSLIVEQLDAVPSLDDDRTLRALLALVDATSRTNVFRLGDGVAHRPVMSFKLDPAKVPDLPLPRPMYEIWVCSPRVEGVHLRGGRIARGGIRWSDRREDFRTEILGLVKAQMVKNAVIVPTGAKGGFVVKRPVDGDRLRDEGVACYREFIAGLLDLTDDLAPDGTVVPPPSTVRYDADDPYLVVAADKGTATFSDLANEIAGSYGFWLGDAFASGGSAGYDHKDMAITARGAWESVRRHARAIGKNADADPLTIVGIGDMSGDVFGNGLLRSPHLKLVAAFDHRHVFLDPDPEPAASFAERQRLYGLPRSSWADYDTSVLSPGGGIFPRTAKRIDISPEAQRAIGANGSSFTPVELISAILRAPIDVLWNGGIGTYVKASSETHAEVGDRSNDALRVDGSQLRCRIVAEGGNLGLTQRGRIEYALRGGLINTDAIDNSAGVDCSDHEVNIKILLSDAMVSTGMTVAERDELLASMTDDVAELVLDDNRAQTLVLAIARRQASAMANVHARYLNVLESEGWLNRALEFLPTDKQIAERQSQGTGLTTPEFSVLLAYTKTTNIELLVDSALPDDPYLAPELIRYFPPAVRERFAEQIARHRLRREIIATQVGNEMVNVSGISFDHRITEDTGVAVVEISRAWVAVRDISDVMAAWERIEALGTAVKLDTQLDLFLELRWMIERAVLWLLRHRRPPLDLGSVVAEFRPGMQELLRDTELHLRGRMRDQVFAREASRLAAGVPESLAQEAAMWPLLHTSFDVIDLARARRIPVRTIAATYWEVFDRLDACWLWNAITTLPRSDRWQTSARAAVRDDLLGALASLTNDALYAGSVDAWMSTNERLVERSALMFTEIRRADHYDLTNLAVAVRQLRNLSLTSNLAP